MNPEIKSPPEQRRKIEVIKAVRGYHTPVADTQYAIARFRGQTGLVIPELVSKSVGREVIQSLVQKYFGDQMDDMDMECMEFLKNGFVIEMLPPSWQPSESEQGTMEDKKEVLDKINNLITDVETVFEQNEQNRFN